MNRLLAICFKKVISFISFMSSVSFCMESGCRFRDGLAQLLPFIDVGVVIAGVEQMKIIDIINHTKTPDFFENHHQKLLQIGVQGGFGFRVTAWPG